MLQYTFKIITQFSVSLNLVLVLILFFILFFFWVQLDILKSIFSHLYTIILH